MMTIVRTALTYLFLYFVIRVMGRRATQFRTGFELILVFLFGGLTIQSILYDDHSLTNSWLAVMTMAVLHMGITSLERRFDRVGSVLEGTPIPICEGGKWDRDRMQQLHLRDQDVMAEARAAGMTSLGDLDTVIVERNGALTLFPKRPPSNGARD